jgi:serine/threonine-protein kinase
MSDNPTRIGRYDVVRLLGEGGMGRVFLARDPVLERDVAIKILRDDLGLADDVKASLVERLQREARAAATVRHPNLVTLHDMGEDPKVGLFLVFEYVPGPTLRERGVVPPLEIARIAMELGDALATAHHAGVVHRDVKPENVICSSPGAVLTDFGLARLPDSTLTAKGVTPGSVAYAAPETLVPGGAPSPASDQFSLAATLFEALSGKRAFAGADVAEVAERVAKADPPPLTDENTDFREKLMLSRAEGVFRRALQKEPTLRYPTCRAFGDALGSAIDVRVSSSFPIMALHSSSIVPKATRRWQNIVLAIALGVIVILVLMGRRERSDSRAQPVPPSSVHPPNGAAP